MIVIHLWNIVFISKLFILHGLSVDDYNMVPSKILRQFPGYNFAFHYDKSTQYELHLFFRQHLESTTILLFNYQYKLDGFHRPSGYKYLHIVLLENPYTFEKFSAIRFNLIFNDAVIFVQEHYLEVHGRTDGVFPENRFWQLEGLNKCGSIFLFVLTKNDFYYVHYYVGKTSGKLKPLMVSNDGEVPKFLENMNNFTDFKGHVFNVAYFPNPPFIWCTDVLNIDTGKYECIPQGIDGNILLIISEYLNFKFVMRMAEWKPEGIWSRMIEDVGVGRRDWALGGISITLERTQYCDFTTMLHMESYTAFYTSPKLILDDWIVVLRPFQAASWIFLLVVLTLVAILLGLAEKATTIDQSKRRPILDFIRVLFHTVVDQSIPRLHVRAVTVRLILVVWFLASIILATAYKSKLAASMIIPNRHEPNTVLNLYEMGFYFQVNIEDWTVLQQNLMHSIDVRYQQLLDRFYDDLEFCDAIQKTMGNKVAIVDEETLLSFQVFNSCQHLYTTYQFSRFRLVKKGIFPSVHAWPLVLGAPFKRKFSHTFQQLMAAGIIEHWYGSLIGRSIKKSNTDTVDSSTSNALTTDTFIGPAFILVFGEMVAGVVLIMEIIHKKYTT